jgi:hypothetical protein
MKWTNIETKSPPIGVTMNLLRQGNIVAFGKCISKTTTEVGNEFKFIQLDYPTHDVKFPVILADITHYHIPKPPDGRTKPI